MNDIIVHLFGEFGLYIFGGMGAGILALFGFIARRLHKIDPRTGENERQIQAIKDHLKDLEVSIQEYKISIEDEIEGLKSHKETLDKRLDKIHERLDDFVGQTLQNYQALSMQISEMQRGMLGRQDNIIQRQAELLDTLNRGSIRVIDRPPRP